MKRVIIISIFFICITAMVYCTFHIYLEMKDCKQGDDLYAAVREDVESDPDLESEPDPDEYRSKSEIQLPKIDFKKLSKTNHDIVAWIYEKNTIINYPVVQANNNEYYLNHLFDKQENKNGCIFMDVRNQKDFSSPHTILYGHHMKNGSMFGSLVNYKDKRYYKKHKTLILLTPEKNYYIHLFAGYVCSENGNAWQQEFLDEKEWNRWIQSAKEQSDFKSKTSPKTGDLIITLSTCSYEFKNARYVLHGILKEVQQ